MRIFTLLSLFLFTVIQLQAQKVVVNSPSTIAGSKLFSAAAFGADLTSNVWTADAVFVNDGSANPNQGCNALTNGVDVACKIALVDRGSCEFGRKALNAETAGAIAVIIFNNAPGGGTIAPGAGAVGGQVTIPCVMLNYEDGQVIRAALATGAVNISIGNITLANDLASSVGEIINPANGTVPASQVKDAGDYVFTPGAYINNIGTSAQSGVNLKVTIDHIDAAGNLTNVYDKNAAAGNLDVDSSTFLTLEDYDAGVNGVGIYDVNYVISGAAADEAPVDNNINSTFFITENVWCEGGWDVANNRPFRTNAYRRASGTEIEFLSPFYMKYGKGYQVDSTKFYISTATGSFLDSVQLNIYLYEWEDLNADGGPSIDEIKIAGFNTIDFPASGSPNSAWVTLPILDFESFEPGYKIPKDGLTYLLGVRYEGLKICFFGFDENYDQFAYISYLDGTFGGHSLIDEPYLWVSAWIDGQPDWDGLSIFTDFYGSTAQALYVNSIETDVKLTVDDVEMKMYPNPVSDLLVTEVKLKHQAEYLYYQITDATGRTIMVQRADNTQEDNARFRVSSLPSGQYFFTIRTDAGTLTKPFTVTH